MIRSASALALLTALAAAPAAGAQVQLPLGQPAPSQQPAQDPSPPQSQQQPTPHKSSKVRLSDERRLTRWAHALDRAPVRVKPNSKAKRVTRLRYDTEDGMPEVYLLLREYKAGDGSHWVQLRVPMRPNGRTGWVRRADLGKFHVVRTFLLVDRHRERARLYRSGRLIWHAPVGVGRPGMPTPSGHFWVRELLRVYQPNSLYGPLAFGTSAYSRLTDWPGGGVVGIHGTNEPALIPGRPSHGCVRVRNPAVRRLGRLMPIGTPVRIR